MIRRWGVSLAIMLLAANFAFGQAEEVEPEPPPDEAQTPSAGASNRPLFSCFNGVPSWSRGAFSVQPEYMLWFLKGTEIISRFLLQAYSERWIPGQSAC